MSAARSERLVNLVVCLLATRQFLSAERIRGTVAGYDDAPTDEAFFRMFERDKAELRELGVPLETGRNSHFDPLDGYRIARRDYELPEIELEPDEAAAVGIAAQLWDSPDLAAAARSAVLKLRAAGVTVDASSTTGPRVRATDPAFDPLVAAVEAGRTVRFRHRRNPTAEPVERTVDPWGVVSYRGRWYLVGHDHDRDDVRCFRLSRITEVKARGAAGTVTVPEVDLLALVEDSAGPHSAPVTARLHLAPGRALGLRRHGRAVANQDGGAADGGAADGDVVEVDFPTTDAAAREVAGYGAHVVVLGPDGLRDRGRRTAPGCSGHRRRAPVPEPVGTGAGTVSALTERMPRLLALVPYLQAHPGVRVEDAATELGVSASQLRRDLELLWMCGLPGYGPGELIDLSFEGETVSVVFDAGLSRPLRLSHAEAGALAVCLRALGDFGGLVGRDVVERALAKVEAAAGERAPAAGVAVSPSREELPDDAVTGAVGDALAGRHPVHIRYFSASRDDVTERVVEPHELLVVAGRSYLEAWCRRAEDVRLFRLDRIERAVVLPEVLAPDPAHAGEDRSAGVPFDLGGDLPLAELVLEPAAAWVAEYYPVERLTSLDEGRTRVWLRYSDREWLVRLALGLGTTARVVEPAEVSLEVRERAAAALAGYPGHG